MGIGDLDHFQRAEGPIHTRLRRFGTDFKMGIDDLSNFWRAEGPVHTSLGQRPRTGDNNAIEG